MRFTLESLRSVESRDLNEIQPESIEEAKTLREEINRRILMIDMAISDPNRTDEDGNRLTGNDYWEWRSRAVAAQSFARMRMRQLKDWIANADSGSNNRGGRDWTRIADALERIAEALEAKNAVPTSRV